MDKVLLKEIRGIFSFFVPQNPNGLIEAMGGNKEIWSKIGRILYDAFA